MRSVKKILDIQSDANLVQVFLFQDFYDKTPESADM